MVKRKPPHPLDAHEAWVQSKPDRYAITAFRGSGVFARGEQQTFEKAVALARQFYTNRPVGVYAVRGSNQSHVINVDNGEITMAYLLIWKGAHSDVGLTVYASAEAAAAALKSVADPEKSGAVVSSDGDLSRANGFTGPSLVALYNGLCDFCGELGDPPDRVTRFATLGDGARRVFMLIEQLAKGMPVISAPVIPPGDPPSQEEGAKEVVTKTKDKEPRAKRGDLNRPVGKVADLKKVGAESRRGKLLKLMDGRHTPEAVASKLELTQSQLGSYLSFFSREAGIGSAVQDGKLVAVYPGSKTIEDVIG